MGTASPTRGVLLEWRPPYVVVPLRSKAVTSLQDTCVGQPALPPMPSRQQLALSLNATSHPSTWGTPQERGGPSPARDARRQDACRASCLQRAGKGGLFNPASGSVAPPGSALATALRLPARKSHHRWPATPRQGHLAGGHADLMCHLQGEPVPRRQPSAWPGTWLLRPRHAPRLGTHPACRQPTAPTAHPPSSPRGWRCGRTDGRTDGKSADSYLPCPKPWGEGLGICPHWGAGGGKGQCPLPGSPSHEHPSGTHGSNLCTPS